MSLGTCPLPSPATLPPMAPPVVLTIAGFDPSSGAGITADIKTAAAHGCFGVACITALTVQSTLGVRRVEPVSAATVSDTLAELAADTGFEAVKIGMLGSAEVATVVAAFLERHRPPNIVLDPILKASSGACLVDAEGLGIIQNRLLPLADVITPNLDEAGALAGVECRDLDGMRAAAAALAGKGARAVVVTGGHLDTPVDFLWFGGLVQEFLAPKIDSKSTHGTGCAFSMAIACRLALGNTLPEAVGLAKQYVTEAIRSGPDIGRGTGPLNHFVSRT